MADAYLEKNKQHWEKGYAAPNVESYIFRFAGRILKPEFDLPKEHERCVDFGCGQGAAVNYFTKLGFNACGCDISTTDIQVAKARYPHIRDKFVLCDPKPSKNECYCFREDVSVVVAGQSLYYFQKSDFMDVLTRLHSAMKDGGVFFASMMGEQHTFFKHSEPTDDPWLRVINYQGRRAHVKDYYNFFVKDEDDLKQKFALFKPVHTGCYSMQLQDGETNNFHWVFIGQK